MSKIAVDVVEVSDAEILESLKERWRGLHPYELQQIQKNFDDMHLHYTKVGKPDEVEFYVKLTSALQEVADEYS